MVIGVLDTHMIKNELEELERAAACQSLCLAMGKALSSIPTTKTKKEHELGFIYHMQKLSPNG